MPTLDIGGKQVQVGDEFLKLPPEQQQATVEEIASSFTPQQSVTDKLLGRNGPRYQTWPERLARGVAESAASGATFPGDVMAGKADPLDTKRQLDMAGLIAPMNPGVRAGDLAIPGLKMAKRAKITPPGAQELKDSAGTGYQRAAEMPLDVRATAVQDFGRSVQSELERQGFRDQFAPGTFSVLKDLQQPPGGSIATGQDLEVIRQSLNVAGRSVDPRERAAAAHVLDSYDKWRSGLTEADVLAGTPAASNAAYSNARANYATAQRSNKISGELDDAYTGIIDRGELAAATANSGQNVGNSIRQRAKSLLQSRKDLRGFSEQEVAGIESLATGTATSNAARYVGNMLGGGGGLGQALTSAGGAAAGAAAGGPVGAAIGGVAAPLIGASSKTLANELTRRQARLLDEAIRSRSPLFKEMQSRAPFNSLPAERQAALLRGVMLDANQQ